MPQFSRLTKVATGKSDGTGALTLTFEKVETGSVWRGSVFVDAAPVSSSWRVTVSGVPWGTAVGGQALLIEACDGDQVQVVTSNTTPLTTFTAWWNGSAVSEEVPAEVGYFNPFPGTTH